MRFSEKLQLDGGLESDSRQWEIGFRSKLRPIRTRRQTKVKKNNGFEEVGEEEYCTTPTGRETRLTEKKTCPGAPRKQRPTPSATCRLYGGARQFFSPPDLETVFVWRG